MELLEKKFHGFINAVFDAFWDPKNKNWLQISRQCVQGCRFQLIGVLGDV